MCKRIVMGWLVLAVSAQSLAVELSADFYGEVNVAYDFTDAGEDDFVNYVSRIGVKGKYELTDHLDVIYKAEQQVDPVHGGTDIDTLFSLRNTYIGLSGDFGKFFFGAHDTPTKNQGKLADIFNDQAGDIKAVTAGEIRSRDAWFYHSPKWQNIELQVAYVPADNVFGSSQSMSLSWSADDLKLAVAVDKDMRKNERAVARTQVYDTVRMAATYQPGPLRIGLLLDRTEIVNTASDVETGFVASVAYKIGNLGLKAQHGNSDILRQDAKSTNLGVDYKIADGAMVYLYYWKFDDGTAEETISLGVEYKF